MTQGARTDLEPSANLRNVISQPEAALFNVSERMIRTVKAEAKRNSCGNSCPQDADNIGKSELHELHESICTQEDDVIEITDLEGAEVKK